MYNRLSQYSGSRVISALTLNPEPPPPNFLLLHLLSALGYSVAELREIDSGFPTKKK